MHSFRYAIIIVVGLILRLSSIAAQPIKGRDHSLGTRALAATTVWTFPQRTWVENLVVRSNGQILTTLLTSPQLYQVDPTGKSPASLVYTFPAHTSCFGISELGHDIFYVVAGNYSLTTFAVTPGSFAVYKVNMNGFTPGGLPSVSKVFNFPNSGELNGMTVLNSAQGLLAIADSVAGDVLSLNVNTGTISQLVISPLMSPNATIAPMGINGLKVRGSSLYFTNTNRNAYAAVPINSNGSPNGEALALSSLTSTDDFQFDTLGNAYFANDDTVSKATALNGAISVF